MIKTSANVKIEIENGVMRAYVAGEIDHHSAAQIRAEIDEKIYELRPSALYLELSGVGFMDSSGLGLIMGRYSLMKKLGGSMTLLEPSEAIMRIVKLSGMDRMINIQKSRPEGQRKEGKR